MNNNSGESSSKMDFKGWKYHSFAVSYDGKTRTVDVFTKAPASAAMVATGRSPDEDISLVRISSADERFRAFWTRKRPQRRELADFFRCMQSCAERLDDLKTSISIASAKARTEVFRGVLANIYYERDQVTSPWELFARYPFAFDTTCVAVLNQGYEGGNVAGAYKRLSEYADESNELMSEIIAALWYPGVLMMAVSGLLVFVAQWVFPKVSGVFMEMNFTLPLPTRILMFAMNNLVGSPIILGISIALAIIVFLKRHSFLEKEWVQRYLLKLPALGNYYQKVILERSLRTLSELVGGGVPQKKAYAITAKVAGNYIYRDYFLAISEHLSKGGGLYESYLKERSRIGKIGLEVATEMRVAGNSSDHHAIIGRAASYYRKELSRINRTLPRLVEPVLIVVVGAVVGLVMLALVLPNLNFALKSMQDANRFGGSNAQAVEQTEK